VLTSKLVCLLKGHNYRRIVKGDSTYSICLRYGKLAWKHTHVKTAIRRHMVKTLV
jgi:hypothetical protein